MSTENGSVAEGGISFSASDIESLDISISLPDSGRFVPGEAITGNLSLEINEERGINQQRDIKKEGSSKFLLNNARLHLLIEGRVISELQPMRFSKAMPNIKHNEVFLITNKDIELDQNTILSDDGQSLLHPFALTLDVNTQNYSQVKQKTHHSGKYLPWEYPEFAVKQEGSLLPPTFVYSLEGGQREVHAAIEYRLIAVLEDTSSQLNGPSSSRSKAADKSRVAKCPFIVTQPPISPEAESIAETQRKRDSSIVSFEGPQITQDQGGRVSAFKRAKTFLSSKTASLQTMANVIAPSNLYLNHPFQLGIYLKAPEFPPGWKQPQGVLKGPVPDITVVQVTTKLVQRIRATADHGFNSEDNILDHVLMEDSWAVPPGSTENILRAPPESDLKAAGNVVVAHMRALPARFTPSFSSKYLDLSYILDTTVELECKGVKSSMEAKPAVVLCNKVDGPDGQQPPVYLDAWRDAEGSGRQYKIATEAGSESMMLAGAFGAFG